MEQQTSQMMIESKDDFSTQIEHSDIAQEFFSDSSHKDCQKLVFQFLQGSDLLNLAQVNRYMWKICHDPKIWDDLFSRNFQTNKFFAKTKDFLAK
jgi:hypothetical protein